MSTLDKGLDDINYKELYPLKVIKNKRDYEWALKSMQAVFDEEKGPFAEYTVSLLPLLRVRGFVAEIGHKGVLYQIAERTIFFNGPPFGKSDDIFLNESSYFSFHRISSTVLITSQRIRSRTHHDLNFTSINLHRIS